MECVVQHQKSPAALLGSGSGDGSDIWEGEVPAAMGHGAMTV